MADPHDVAPVVMGNREHRWSAERWSAGRSQCSAHGVTQPHAAAVLAAADRDVDEHGSFYVLLASARPVPGGPPGPGRVVLRTTDSYALSGVVLAAAAAAVLAGTVPPGSHLAAEALDPVAVADVLRADPLVDELTVS